MSCKWLGRWAWVCEGDWELRNENVSVYECMFARRPMN